MQVQTTDRQTELLTAIDAFLDEHDIWSDDVNLSVLTEEYEVALTDLLTEFAIGDMPSSMRHLDRAVDNLRQEWEAYEAYVSKASPQPNSAFWAAVAKVRSVRKGVEEVDSRPIETVQQLHAQGVNNYQIAVIYSHQGKGPFMKLGIPQAYLVQQELDQPGSVIGKDFVHPAKLAQAAASAEAKARWRSRTESARPAKPIMGPESFEELISQGLTAEQIAKIKLCSAEEVRAEAAKLGATLAEPVNLATLRAPHEPEMTDVHKRQLEARLADASTAANKPVESPVQEEESEVESGSLSIKEQALELSDAGNPCSQIAKKLGMTVTACASLLKEAKKKREALATAESE